jgi:phosphohistidine phosphatase SixA
MDAPPGLALRHRPFLAPVWLAALIPLLVAVVGLALLRTATTTTVVIVRNAESVLGSIADPPLIADGERRAARLAYMLAGVPGSVGRITAIYVASGRRTQQTVAPLASLLNLPPIIVPDTELGSLAQRILSAHRGQSVLIVGYAATVAPLVRALTGTTLAPVREDDYGAVYVISVPPLGSAGILRLRY